MVSTSKFRKVFMGSRNMNSQDEEIYKGGAIITGLIIFVGAWIYCIVTYGFLLGVGLGWLPAAITAVVAGLLWPLIAAVLLLGLAWFIIVLWRSWS
jgi:hypothetical protein